MKEEEKKSETRAKQRISNHAFSAASCRYGDPVLHSRIS